MTPLDRCRFLDENEHLDLGDRTITTVRPRAFDTDFAEGRAARNRRSVVRHNDPVGNSRHALDASDVRRDPGMGATLM